MTTETFFLLSESFTIHATILSASIVWPYTYIHIVYMRILHSYVYKLVIISKVRWRRIGSRRRRHARLRTLALIAIDVVGIGYIIILFGTYAATRIDESFRNRHTAGRVHYNRKSVTSFACTASSADCNNR